MVVAIPVRSSVVTDAEASVSESDSSLNLDMDMVAKSENPSCLEQWRRHENYDIGMRMAQLATFWLTNGLPNYKFPSFLAWMDEQCFGLVGDTNHSYHFLDEFAASLGGALKDSMCASLHT
eukprot:9143043-Lingulodinium_polyedra.AAC.1